VDEQKKSFEDEVRKLEDDIVESIRAKNLQALLSNLDSVGLEFLGFKHVKRVSSQYIEAATYFPKEKITRTCDVKAMREADKEALVTGSSECKENSTYLLGTTSNHYYDRLFKKKNGFVNIIRVEGFVEDKRCDLLRNPSMKATQISMCGWGEKWRYTKKPEQLICPVRAKQLGVPGYEKVKELELSDVMERIRLNIPAKYM